MDGPDMKLRHPPTNYLPLRSGIIHWDAHMKQRFKERLVEYIRANPGCTRNAVIDYANQCLRSKFPTTTPEGCTRLDSRVDTVLKQLRECKTSGCSYTRDKVSYEYYAHDMPEEDNAPLDEQELLLRDLRWSFSCAYDNTKFVKFQIYELTKMLKGARPVELTPVEAKRLLQLMQSTIAYCTYVHDVQQEILSEFVELRAMMEGENAQEEGRPTERTREAAEPKEDASR